MASRWFSLLIGVEAVKRVPEFNRGTALGVYTAVADVSFFLVGPIAGALIGFFGYSSVFLFALISVLLALELSWCSRDARGVSPAQKKHRHSQNFLTLPASHC